MSAADDDRVAAALSHDVRGALRGVTGFLGLADRAGELPDEARSYVDTARRSAATADLMLDRLVRWLRIGSRPVELAPVPLGAVTAAAVDAVRAASAGPDLRLHVDDAAAGLVVRAERALLLECLVELLANARTFADRGSGEVDVWVTAEVGDGVAVVDLADAGPGIPSHLAEAVFELFRLLQARGKHAGVGMGLPIARRLAAVQGGRLEVVASDAPGATLRLSLDTAT